MVYCAAFLSAVNCTYWTTPMVSHKYVSILIQATEVNLLYFYFIKNRGLLRFSSELEFCGSVFSANLDHQALDFVTANERNIFVFTASKIILQLNSKTLEVASSSPTGKVSLSFSCFLSLCMHRRRLTEGIICFTPESTTYL